jgi:hypothetical protein
MEASVAGSGGVRVTWMRPLDTGIGAEESEYALERYEIQLKAFNDSSTPAGEHSIP